MNIFKKLQIILVVILCLSLTMLFVACDPDDDGDTPPETTITVTFNTNGGSTIASDAIDADFIMPANPTKEGYIFLGWCFDEALTQYATNAAIIAKTESFTIYAKWQKIPTATFETNGGSTVASDLVDADFTLPTPTKAGFYFDGWYFDSAFTQVATLGAIRTKTQDVTLYAKWIEIVVIRVTFDTNGGSTIASDVIDSDFTMPANPTKAGFYFDGWYFDSALTQYASPSAIRAKEESFTVYAKWQEIVVIPDVVVTFNTNGGSTIASDVIDNDFTMPADPTKAGFVFDGWYFDSALTQLATPGAIRAKSESFTIYAKWIEQIVVNDVNVTFETNGGSTIPADIIDASFVMPANPTKAGYIFDGWYFDSALTQPATNGAILTKAESFTIYAKWIEIVVINVTFETNGGSTIPADVIDDDFVMPADPTKAGYIFDGWYFDSALTQPATNGAILSKAESFTIYAKWEEVVVITITFETNGGSTIAQDVLDGDFAMPADPTKADYTFDGWYFDEALTVRASEATIRAQKESFTLYAKWAPIQWNIPTPTVSFADNILSWNAVSVSDLPIAYCVTIDDGLQLMITTTSFSLDAYEGQHKVSVYAVLAQNTEVRSGIVTQTVNVVPSGDVALTDVKNNPVNGATYSMAKENGQDVLIFYPNLTVDFGSNIKNFKADKDILIIEGTRIAGKNIYSSCNLTLTTQDDTTITYKAYVRPLVQDFELDSRYELRNTTGFQNQSDIKKYTVGTANAFAPATVSSRLVNSKPEPIEGVYVPVEYTVTGDGITSSDYIITKDGIDFEDSAIGKTAKITVEPKFLPEYVQTQYGIIAKSLTVQVVSGVNVYDNEGLKKAVEDTTVEQISIHNEIVAAYNDQQKFDGVDYARHIPAMSFTKANYKTTANVYARYVDSTDTNKSLTINGNFFKINAKDIAHVQVDKEKGYNVYTGQAIDVNNGGLPIRNEDQPDAYEVCNQEVGVFAFAAKGGEFTVTFNDLHIRGNCDLTNETDVAELAKAFVLKQSGSLHGIVASKATLKSNNVWIQNVMQGYQLRNYAGSWLANVDVNEWLAGSHTIAEIDYSRVENTFYSSVYVCGAKASIKNSYFRNAGCATIAISDYTPDAFEAGDYNGFPYDPEVTLDSTNVYENWSIGTEAYYATEPMMASLVPALKAGVMGMLSGFPGENIPSIVKKTNGAEKYNLILQFNEEWLYKKATINFTQNGVFVQSLNRGKNYVYTSGDPRKATVGGTTAFLSPVGQFSNVTDFLALVGQKMGEGISDEKAAASVALAESFVASNTVTFGKNNDRRFLEIAAIVSGEGGKPGDAGYMTDELTVLVEYGISSSDNDWVGKSPVQG